VIAAHPWRRELRLVDQAGATNCPRIPTSALPLPRHSFAVECTLLAHTLVAIACVQICYTSHQDTVFPREGHLTHLPLQTITLTSLRSGLITTSTLQTLLHKTRHFIGTSSITHATIPRHDDMVVWPKRSLGPSVSRSEDVATPSLLDIRNCDYQARLLLLIYSDRF
jgi:hypothetical protein